MDAPVPRFAFSLRSLFSFVSYLSNNCRIWNLNLNMVNYCCVAGCSRNSRTHCYLNFFTLPKEKDRRTEWLKCASRDDLLPILDDKKLSNRRVCSRHFAPESLKNKHLNPDAVPTLFLDGGCDDDHMTKGSDHPGIVCNNCSNLIFGFRYKCVKCVDYDLCQKCEVAGAHSAHYMIRFPKSVLLGNAQNLTRTWRDFATKVAVDNGDAISVDSDSSDDVPITQYKRKYDQSELTEDVKAKIRKEINRVLDAKIDEWEPKVKVTMPKKKSMTKEMSQGVLANYFHQVEFADVEEPEKFEGNSEVKIELSSAASQPQSNAFVNDALSEFLIKRS